MHVSILLALAPAAVLGCLNANSNPCASFIKSQAATASPFCATFTKSVVTATAGLPAWAANCSNKPNLLSAECSCHYSGGGTPATTTRAATTTAGPVVTTTTSRPAVTTTANTQPTTSASSGGGSGTCSAAVSSPPDLHRLTADIYLGKRTCRIRSRNHRRWNRNWYHSHFLFSS